MKTITFKADERFDSLLSRLASRLKTSKSNIIREAVHTYQKVLDRQALERRIRKASMKTRDQALKAAKDFEGANNDGL